MRMLLLATVAAAGLAVAAGPASATSIFVSDMALPFSETVTLHGGLFDGADLLGGQQVLTANYGSSYDPGHLFTILAWCVDIPHHITIGADSIPYVVDALSNDHSGTDAATSNPLTAQQVREIRSLVAYGNHLMATSPSNTVSAAVQAAIWDIEYGATSPATGGDPALEPLVASLEALAPTLPPADGLVLDSFDGHGHYEYQALMFVPEPASLALLGTGLLGLAGLRRRVRPTG